MNTIIRRYAAGIATSIALVGLCLAFPQWPQALGLEVATGPRACCTLVVEPGVNCEILRARIDAKSQIISRLRAGELDLFEAAGWFGHVNREPAEYADHMWQSLPGDSNEEKLCRQVILWARGNLAQVMARSELDAFIAELEVRLAARLCDRGRVELPQWR